MMSISGASTIRLIGSHVDNQPVPAVCGSSRSVVLYEIMQKRLRCCAHLFRPMYAGANMGHPSDSLSRFAMCSPGSHTRSLDLIHHILHELFALSNSFE